MNRKKILAAAACAACLATTRMAMAQLTLTGTSYSQGFDDLGTNGLPTGWTVRTGATATGLGGAGAFNMAAGTWSDSGGAFKNLAAVGSLASNASTAVQNAATDRALGIRQTGAVGDPGAAFTLQIGNTIGRTNFSLNFLAEMLSVQTRSTVWTLQYGLGTAPTSFTDLATYNDPGAFGTTSIAASAALSGIENQSQNVWLRIVTLSATTGSGSRDTFGIDQFNLSWTGSGPPPIVPQYWDLNGSTAGIGGAATATWDGGTTNWTPLLDGTGTPAAYNPANIAVFGGTAGTVAIDAGGVTENGGIQFTSNGYTLAGGGGAVTLGTDSSITVTNNTDTATISSGLAGTNGMVKAGAGTLVLTSNNSYTGGTSINGGWLKVSADSQLGDSSGTITLGGGTLLTTADLTTSRTVSLSAASTIDTGAFKMTLNSAIVGGSGLTKAGTGTLLLTVPAPTFTGGLTINGGAVQVTSADGNGNTGIGGGNVVVNSGGAFELNNVNAGTFSGTTGPVVILNNGGTLRAIGSVELIRSSSPSITTTGTSVFIDTSAGATLGIGAAVRNATGGVSDSPTNIHITGAGTVVLQAGGTSTATTGFTQFTGGWVVDGGVLQLGPGAPGAGVTSGEVSNALGYDGGTAGLVSQMRPVTINAGGIFADSFDQGYDVNSGTIEYTSVRNPFILSGGTFTGVAGASPLLSGAISSATNTTSTISLIDLSDPGSSRSVTLTNFTYNNGTSTFITPGNLAWGANSTVNLSGNGTLNINRLAADGTVTVGANANLVVPVNATVNLGSTGSGGDLDAFYDGTNGVNIANSGSFNVLSGSKNVGNLTGTGTTTVSDGVTLTANVVKQDTLAITNTGIVKIRPETGAPNNTAHTSVVNNLLITPLVGKLDLANDSMILNNSAASTPLNQLHAADVRLLLQNGTIFSSSTTTDKTLGYGDNSVLKYGTFAGQIVDLSAELIKYTYAGDSNLDGQVDVTDLGALASHWQLPGNWTEGDYNYDGVVNVTDLGILASDWQKGVGAPLGMSFQQALAEVGLGNVAVPEPASLSLLGLSVLGLAARRRRQ